MPTMKRSEELFVDDLEVSSIEICQENVQNHENYMCSNTCTYV